MLSIFKNLSTGSKRFTLGRLTKKSIASIASIQSAANRLGAINNSIDRTTHEIEEIEASFSLIKGELGQRKTNNATIIAQIKSIGEKNEGKQLQVYLA